MVTLLISCTHQAQTARREPLPAIVGPYEVPISLGSLDLASFATVGGKDAGLETRHRRTQPRLRSAYYATDLSFVIQFTQSDKSFSQSHNSPDLRPRGSYWGSLHKINDLLVDTI